MHKEKVPSEFDALNAEITQGYDGLSKRLKQVAEYVLERPKAVAMGTVSTIAHDGKVHPSTLVRFSHAFGFAGFSDMQKVFRQKLLEEPLGYNERIELIQGSEKLEASNSGLRLLDEINEANYQALGHVIRWIKQEDLDNAVDLLKSASAVHVRAVRRSYAVASYLAYLLNNSSLRCFLLDGVGGMQQEQEHLICKDDTLVAVSFFPYAKETLLSVQHAIKQGSPVIAITDSPLSPLADIATVCFIVKEAEVHSFRSLTVTMSLVQALTVSLIHQLKNLS